MKTTIELPDDLFLQAKRNALEQGTTLKALIEAGLRHGLAQTKQRKSKHYKFPVITKMAKPTTAQADLNGFIDQMREDGSALLLAQAASTKKSHP